MNDAPVAILPVRTEEVLSTKANPVTTSCNNDNNNYNGGGSAPKYRMVALDLDGTLLQSNHQMAKVQAEYLQSLQARGLTVCIATGRAAPSVYEHVRALNFPVPVPVVCSNGARGFLCGKNSDNKQLENQELFYTPVPKHVVEQTIAIANQHGFGIHYYYEDSIYVNSKTDALLQLTATYSSLTGSPVHPVDDDFASLLGQNHLPSKLLILFDESRIEEAKQLYQDKLQSSNNDTSKRQATIVLGSFDWFLEILHPDVTKGSGLQNMCQALQIPMEECIAMGDGANDIEFLQMAGMGVAMKNAKDLAKKVADSTMEWTNDNHGVMKSLQTMERQGLLHMKLT